jgi:hypothetical protein
MYMPIVAFFIKTANSYLFQRGPRLSGVQVNHSRTQGESGMVYMSTLVTVDFGSQSHKRVALLTRYFIVYAFSFN